jgi:hypothetical protein
VTLRRIMRAQEFRVFLILGAMMLFLNVFTRTFLASTNIFNILRASVNPPVAVLCGLAAGLQESWTV